MKRIGSYHIEPFSSMRRNITLITHQGWKKHTFHTLIDVDVTDAVLKIKQQYERTGEKYSFTGWIITCITQALSQHKSLNAYRKGRKKIVLFDDIDIAIPIERIINKEPVPMAYIIRNTQKKSLQDITQEIRTAQLQHIEGNKQVLDDALTPLERFAVHSPMFLKKLLLFILNKKPLLKKKHMGTIGVTAVGMKGRFPGWIIPLGGTTTMLFCLSGIDTKPGIVNEEEIDIRKYLHITLSVDHDIIDGGPLARFLDDFITLCEQSHGLTK